MWLPLGVGLVIGWIAGMMLGHSLRVEDQWDETLRLLRAHVRCHRGSPRITLTEEDADSEWEGWELN